MADQSSAVISGLSVTRAGIRSVLLADKRRTYTPCIRNFRIRSFFLIIQMFKCATYMAMFRRNTRTLAAHIEGDRA
jgi:hypothetical protein